MFFHPFRFLGSKQIFKIAKIEEIRVEIESPCFPRVKQAGGMPNVPKSVPDSLPGSHAWFRAGDLSFHCGIALLLLDIVHSYGF